MPSDSGQKMTRLLSLDVLRDISAIFVFLFHCIIIKPGWEENPLKFGVAGVDLFFMISGFVILHTISHTNSLRTFIVNRFTRLYPAYWVAVLFTATIILYQSRGHFPADFLKTCFANLTMVQHTLGFAHLDQQYWTLEVELFFYILVGSVFACGLLHRIAEIGIVLIAMSSAVVLLEVFPKETVEDYEMVTRLPIFLSGMLIYRMRKEGPSRWLIASLVFSVACAVVLFDAGGRSRFYISRFEYALELAVFVSIFFLAVSGRLNFLNIRPLIFLGKISYCLYLFHQYVSTRFLIPQFESRGIATPIAIGLSLLCCIMIAWIATRFIEEPVVRFIRNRMATDS